MMGTLFTAEIVRYFVAFLWLAAVAGKLVAWARFRDNLNTSFGLPPSLAALAAPLVPALELAAAALLLGWPGAPAMLAALLLMGAFTAMVSYKFFTQPVVKCSCFGESERALSPFDVLRNLLVVLAIAGHLALAPAGTLGGAVALLAAGFGAILCVLAIHFHDAVQLLRTS